MKKIFKANQKCEIFNTEGDLDGKIVEIIGAETHHFKDLPVDYIVKLPEPDSNGFTARVITGACLKSI